MTCSGCELQIGDYLEGALDLGTRTRVAAHLSACEACRTLADDLRAIREASRTLGFDYRAAHPEESAGMEPTVPSPDVWIRIAAALEAERGRVTATDITSGAAWERQPQRTPVVAAWLPQRLATAAIVAALVSGVGWLAWRDLSTAPASRQADTTPAEPVPVETDLKLAEDQYVQAIAGLEAITKPDGGALDRQTADVLQTNLTVIDQAIGESRAALQAEPASDLARESLFEALRTKIMLLQDALALINEMRQGNPEGAARIASEIRQ
jgi:hypothetical protein